MSTELVPIDDFGALAEAGDVALAMKENFGEGETFDESLLIRVKIPSGGGKKWVIETAVGEETVAQIEGVLAGYEPRGVLWPSEEDAIEGTMPVLITHDFVYAKRVGDIPDHMRDALDACHVEGDWYDWETLPYAKFGSSSKGSGKGKRVKDQRVLYVLRKKDPFPLIIVAQPGSLKNMKTFIRDISFAGIPHYNAVVSLGLEQTKDEVGNKYSRIVPKLTGQLSMEDGLKVKKQFTEPIREMNRREKFQPL
jgi:hypothetical protein